MFLLLIEKNKSIEVDFCFVCIVEIMVESWEQPGMKVSSLYF